MSSLIVLLSSKFQLRCSKRMSKLCNWRGCMGVFSKEPQDYYWNCLLRVCSFRSSTNWFQNDANHIHISKKYMISYNHDKELSQRKLPGGQRQIIFLCAKAHNNNLYHPRQSYHKTKNHQIICIGYQHPYLSWLQNIKGNKF